jgi:hypothetical protein
MAYEMVRHPRALRPREIDPCAMHHPIAKENDAPWLEDAGHRRVLVNLIHTCDQLLDRSVATVLEGRAEML